MHDQCWTADAAAQVRGFGERALDDRLNEDFTCRTRAPLEKILDLLGGMRLGVNLAGEEVQEIRVILPPPWRAVLVPSLVLLALLEEMPYALWVHTKKDGGTDERQVGNPFGVLRR